MTIDTISEPASVTDDNGLTAGVLDVRSSFDVGNYREALSTCEGLIAYHPERAEPLLLLGLISFELEEPQRALLLLNQAHKMSPNVREYADALACINAQLGDDLEALFFAKMAAILPAHPLGEALLPEKYSNFFESLRDAKPFMFRRRAQRRLEKGDATAALTLCEKQLELSPDDTETWRLLAHAAAEVGNIARVVDACEILGNDTLLASDYDVLARAMAKVGRFDEAERAHLSAIDCEPDNPPWSQSRIRTLAARHGSSGGYLDRENNAWVSLFARPATTERHDRKNSDPKGLLRIAYVGGDFHAGAVVDLLAPILAAHDAEHFLPFCYASNKRFDTASELLSTKCARWVDIHGVDPETVGAIMRGDQIDIAVDLSGHGIGSQLQTFARHPVPVCVSWPIAQHPAGHGFDCLLTSETLLPLGDDPGEVADEIHRLPTSYLAYRPIDAPGTISPLPALGRPHITLGVMAPLAHIGETCVNDWVEILDHVDNARILVANMERLDDQAATRIYELATAAGVRDRIDVAELDSVATTNYGFFDHFDILLDPQPNSRFLETCRSLWMGVPVLAIAGGGYLGRQAADALRAAGKPDWVFDTNQARAASVVELVSDLGRLADLRRTMRKDVVASPLCDVSGFTRSLERAYTDMVSRRS